MSPTIETFTSVLLFLLLGLTTMIIIMIIMVLVKEWTEYKAMQFWPKLRSTRTLDLESGMFLLRDITELTWRVDQLEDHISSRIQLNGSALPTVRAQFHQSRRKSQGPHG
ncbi:uncharacterized protein N7515_005598 [Penicillium bovifimosum]|uniref:Uncharacterized protein n=1 Tax=Penicillium bovifimosum TaxID=126998 RepID=A0A9W9L003_9EURO|nr:uncharacterized protein N7515_005598 [Penicillium bovifimosum]KAJ5129559.1 hypothetical protein N7515_005598 [Penicillium bovifimosum]